MVAALPLDNIVDIFSKLPVKSLCRFKCLSKTLKALITSPQFVKMKQTQTQQSQTLVITTRRKSYGYCLLCVDLDSKQIYEVNSPITKKPYDSIRICSSCSGLLCLCIGKVFYIYNCSTREFKKIPYYEPFNKSHISSVSVGFGYVQSLDDFQVLGFSESYIPSQKAYIVGVHVFSLRNNTWKSYETSFIKFWESSSCAMHLNRTIHFGFCFGLLANQCFSRHFMIAAFDLVEAKFKFLPLPDDINVNYLTFIRVMGDCLCLIKDWDQEIWIMKEYGVKDSWTKISLASRYKSLQPLCSMKDTDFILSVLDDKFVLLDPKDGTYKDFVIDGFESQDLKHYFYYVEVYAESLISPNIKTNFLAS